MSSITINVPTGTESKYKTVLNSIVKNYGVDELEDALLGLHIQNSKSDNNFVREEEVIYNLS